MFRFRNTESGWWPWDYVIEVQGDPVEAYESVRKVFEEVSGIPFEGRFIDPGHPSTFRVADPFGQDRGDLCLHCDPDFSVGVTGDVDLFHPATFVRRWRSARCSVRTTGES